MYPVSSSQQETRASSWRFVNCEFHASRFWTPDEKARQNTSLATVSCVRKPLMPRTRTASRKALTIAFDVLSMSFSIASDSNFPTPKAFEILAALSQAWATDQRRKHRPFISPQFKPSLAKEPSAQHLGLHFVPAPPLAEASWNSSEVSSCWLRPAWCLCRKGHGAKHPNSKARDMCKGNWWSYMVTWHFLPREARTWSETWP